MTPAAWVAIWAIRFYQRYLTRYTRPCPQTPCCSEFGLQAIRTLGYRRGMDETIRRIYECGVR